ncbi:hypothetical protein [Pedobacter sp. N23S346]|uniref:hypothetical protein n=1 Tax=Pedobacter sp. N23S346 TaxID=3402750 RepID=UPI003AC4DA9E
MKYIYIRVGIIISLFSMTGMVVLAQTIAQKIGTNSTIKDASALLELEATNKGFLMTRVALTSLTDVTTINSPAHALMVFNTATTNSGTNDVVPGYYYYNKDLNTPANSKWVKLSDSQNKSASGDVKNSFKTADHAGWFLLDGRAISSLPAAAQAAASELGFTNNLPDATNRFLKTKISSENLGDIGGINELTITVANLPNTTFSGTINGTAASAGAHTHTLPTPLQINDTDRGASGNRSLWSIDNVDTSTTSSSGAHTHTVSGSASVPSGGSGTALDNRSPYLVVNTFIFLAN